MNTIPFEIADAVLFAEYFLHGDSVFKTSPILQLFYTDVNVDGKQGTIEDLAYHFGVVIGKLPPLLFGMKAPDSTVLATFSRTGDIWSIDRSIAVGFIVARGNVIPEKTNSMQDIRYHFDGTNTRMVVFEYHFDRNSGSEIGPLLTVSAPIIYADFATAEGYRVETFYDCCEGIRGDANGDGRENPNVVDLALIVDYLFTTRPHVICPDEADINNSGGINIADVTQLVSYLFQQGQAPVGCP